MRQSHGSSRRRARQVPGQKPRGQFQERVQKVGPEHFAIIPVDCGKMQARARVADFYGNVLMEPFTIDISRSGLQTACERIRGTFRKCHIRDCVCALESTGRYHLVIKQVFQNENWDTRLVHPFTSSLIRRSADLGTKTDDIDLAAIHRAAVDGLAMRPEVLDTQSQEWRVLVRHRRDLVEKAACLKAQLRETFHAYLPGFTGLWKDDNFWESPIGGSIATSFATPQALQEAPDERFHEIAHAAGSKIQRKTIARIKGWTYQAAPPDEAARLHYRRACSLWEDLRSKWRELRDFELEIGAVLCRTPYVLLLAFPGINVVSAADYGAELGPITNYATSKCIAGRAGIYPSRYQSSYKDHADGPLVARRNRELRAALMRIAFNLEQFNNYFKGKADNYAKRNSDHDPNVVTAAAFSRLSYYIIASNALIAHPSLQAKEKILQKLLGFFHEYGAPPTQTVAALDQVITRLSPDLLREEHKVIQLQAQQNAQCSRRTMGIKRLGELLPEVLLRIDQRIQRASSEQTLTSLQSIQDETHGS